MISIPLPIELKNVVDQHQRILLHAPDGLPIAALVTLDDLRYFQSLEDRLDLADAQRIEKEAGQTGYISLHEWLLENGIQSD